MRWFVVFAIVPLFLLLGGPVDAKVNRIPPKCEDKINSTTCNATTYCAWDATWRKGNRKGACFINKTTWTCSIRPHSRKCRFSNG